MDIAGRIEAVQAQLLSAIDYVRSNEAASREIMSGRGVVIGGRRTLPHDGDVVVEIRIRILPTEVARG